MALFLLQAIDKKKAVTKLGYTMASFPLEPPLARSLLASKDNGCTLEMVDILSVLSSSSTMFLDISEQRDSISEVRRKFQHRSGDHMTFLNALHAYEEIAKIGTRAKHKDWCLQHFLNERSLVDAIRIRDQLRLTCDRFGLDWRSSCNGNEEPILKSLMLGLIQNCAVLQPDGSYKQLLGQSVSQFHVDKHKSDQPSRQ